MPIFIGMYYLVFFALPVFALPLTFHIGTQAVLYQRLLVETSVEAVLLVALGIGMMLGAFYVARSTFISRLPPMRLPLPEESPELINAMLWLLMVASLLYHHLDSLQSIPSIGQLLDPVGYLALGGFFLRWRRGLLPRWQVIAVLVVCLPLDVLWRVQHFYLTELLFLPMFFMFLLWRERTYKTITILVLVGAAVAATYGVTSFVRYGSDTLLGKLSAATEAAQRLADNSSGIASPLSLLGTDQKISYDPLLSPLVHRVGQIWVFQHVYDESPKQVPYWGGKTYRPLLTSFIPRMIYPQKPREVAGGEFGYRYGFTTDLNGDTSYNIPWIIELLANFGPIGVILGMGFFGLLLACLARIFNTPTMNDIDFLVGTTIIFRLVYQESNFSEMTGALLWLFASLYGYFWLGTLFERRVWNPVRACFAVKNRPQ